jgi:hypothetical protein
VCLTGKFYKKNGVLERKRREKRKKKPRIEIKHIAENEHIHTRKSFQIKSLKSSIMDESWEELKRNAILLGSWIALIRASTYIFGAFQPQH